MVKQGVNKFRVMAATGLVVMALASAPANAHHDHGYVVPLAAFLAFSAFAHHNHHHRRHYRHGYGHGHGHGHRHHRRHSHSHGGYHRPHKRHHRHW